MIRIQGFTVIISGGLQDIGASLAAFPRHIVASGCDICMAGGIVEPDLLLQDSCDFSSAETGVDIIDLISDGPHDDTGMAAVPADP